MKTAPGSHVEAQNLPPPNQKIPPNLKDSRYKTLIHTKHYRFTGNSTTLMKNTVFLCLRLSPSLGELINHVGQTVSLDDFFHHPTNQYLNSLTGWFFTYHPDTGRLVTVLPGADWWSTGRLGEETSSFGQLYQYENGQLHLPECHLWQKFMKSTGKHLICRHSILSTKGLNYEQ